MPNFDYLSPSEILELRRWSTPTVYNGWEFVTQRDRLECNLSWEPGLTDFMPQMGPMVGYAVTVEFTCKDKEVREQKENPFADFYDYLAEIPGPKIIFAKDLDWPEPRGSMFGEVTGNAFRALGCVGAITDGCARDVDEAAYGGVKLMARRLCVGHAYSCPVRFGCDVAMYGTTVKPGMLVHADKYGFIAIPEEETPYLLEAVRYGDSVECHTAIPAGRRRVGLTAQEIAQNLRIQNVEQAKCNAAFVKEIRERYARNQNRSKGEMR